MRLRNESRLDTGRLRDLLAFAAHGINDTGVMVHVINTTTTFRGWATTYTGQVRRTDSQWGSKLVRRYPSTIKYVIRLMIPKNIELSNWTNVKRIQNLYANGLPPIDTEEDAIIMLAAHEFRHIWQYHAARREKQRGKKAKGRGEYDAEKFAQQRLNDWRKHTGRHRVDPVKQPNPFQAAMSA